MDSPAQVGQHAAALSAEDLLQMYWTMLLSRRVDERAWVLHRQGKIPFHVSAIGHEATQVGFAYAINRGIDFAYLYYRDLTACLAIGMTPTDFMLGLFGKEGEPTSGGRQMPSHWSFKSLNVVTHSAVVTTQVPQAVGSAFAINYRARLGLQDRNDPSQPRLAIATLGEGSSTQGEWAEGLNWAAVQQLPFICVVENNNYAISVPYEKQATLSVAERAEAHGVRGVTVDGTDPLAVYEATREAAERAYTGEGPTCIEALCHRLVPHSSDDDDRTYRSADELRAIKADDPLPKFRSALMTRGVLTDALDETYEARAKQMVNDAHRTAEDAPYPDPELHLDPAQNFAPAEEVH